MSVRESIGALTTTITDFRDDIRRAPALTDGGRDNVDES